MKKLVLAAALTAAAATAGTASAGGIQIDPTGTGSIAGSTLLSGMGNTTGDALFYNLAGNVGNVGTIYGQNSIDVSSTIGGSLTFVFGLSAQSVDPGLGGNSLGYVDVKNPAVNYFSLYWHKTGNPGATQADRLAGSNYDTGILLVKGTLSLDIPQPAFLQQTTPGVVNLDGGVLSKPGATLGQATSLTKTAGLNGAMVLDIEFDQASINHNYVVNNLISASVDLFLTDTLNAPYNKAFGVRSIAPTQVGGTAVGHGQKLLNGNAVGTLGGDTVNDLTCSASVQLAGQCNVQVQMNTTLEFTDAPEPTSLALTGLAVSLAGWRMRRKARTA